MAPSENMAARKSDLHHRASNSPPSASSPTTRKPNGAGSHSYSTVAARTSSTPAAKPTPINVSAPGLSGPITPGGTSCDFRCGDAGLSCSQSPPATSATAATAAVTTRATGPNNPAWAAMTRNSPTPMSSTAPPIAAMIVVGLMLKRLLMREAVGGFGSRTGACGGGIGPAGSGADAGAGGTCAPFG